MFTFKSYERSHKEYTDMPFDSAVHSREQQRVSANQSIGLTLEASPPIKIVSLQHLAGRYSQRIGSRNRKGDRNKTNATSFDVEVSRINWKKVGGYASLRVPGSFKKSKIKKKFQKIQRVYSQCKEDEDQYNSEK